MPKFVMPDGRFTLDQLAKANPNAEPAEVRLWFGDQVTDGNIEIVDPQNGIFMHRRKGSKLRPL